MGAAILIYTTTRLVQHQTMLLDDILINCMVYGHRHLNLHHYSIVPTSNNAVRWYFDKLYGLWGAAILIYTTTRLVDIL